METVSSAVDLQDQYLTLLVTQLRNQDPLEPTKQEDFIGQLAQFATVEGIENLNSQFSAFLEAETNAANARFQSASSASALLGKTVEYSFGDEGPSQTGTVDAIVLEGQQTLIRVSDSEALVPFDKVQSILRD